MTAESWDAGVTRANGFVLVDFWATWCPPCRVLGPILEDLAGEFAGRLAVAKLDVDEHPEPAERFGVQAVPTLILFKDGAPVVRWLGALPARELRRLLEPHLQAATPV
jgi:thioredoxin